MPNFNPMVKLTYVDVKGRRRFIVTRRGAALALVPQILKNGGNDIQIDGKPIK